MQNRQQGVHVEKVCPGEDVSLTEASTREEFTSREVVS